MPFDAFNRTAECTRCIHCAKPRCIASCPVGNDIPQFLRLVEEGKEEQAVQLIGHPFGEVCGYVCPCDRQCVGNCVLSVRGNGVDMGAVEKEVFAAHPYKVERRSEAMRGCKVAVVGGGVAGLTFAVKTYEQGADVTVYERNKLMSTLRLIPEFRLPREAICRIETQFEKKFAVKKQSVGKDLLNELTKQNDIVYLATGTAEIYGLGVEGESFATPYNVFLDTDGDFRNQNGDLRGKKVVIAGGGNTAIDCARTAVRLGAETTVAYRRTRADMPAFEKEIAAAEEEGVQFVYNVAPVCLSKNNALALTVAKTESQGRGKLIVTKETCVILCDIVVSALGGGFDRSILTDFAENARHPYKNLYVGGDAADGKTVAQAVHHAMADARLVTKGLKR